MTSLRTLNRIIWTFRIAGYALLMLAMASIMATLFGGCSYDKSEPAPSTVEDPYVVPGVHPADNEGLVSKGLTSLIGTWTGTTTSTDGHSSNGALIVVLSSDGSNDGPGNSSGTESNCKGNDANHGDSNQSGCPITATVTWTSNKTSLTFHGTASGPLSNVSIVGTDNACTYSASGIASGSTIAGSYAFTGPGCKHDSGNFSLSK